MRWMLVTAPALGVVGWLSMALWFTNFKYALTHYPWGGIYFPGWAIWVSFFMSLTILPAVSSGIGQRCALQSRVRGSWLLWVGASVVGWCASVAVIVAVSSAFESFSAGSENVLVQAVYGATFGLLLGAPLGGITGLALWEMLNRATATPAVEGLTSTQPGRVAGSAQGTAR